MGGYDVVGLLQEFFSIHSCVVWQFLEDFCVESLKGDLHSKVDFSGWFCGSFGESGEVEDGVEGN